jgi:hypothetical protein
MFLFGAPAAPKPQPAPQPSFDDILDLSGPGMVQAQQPQPQPQQGRPPQQGHLLSDFGDLVDLSLGQNQQRPYGRAGFQQRGSGPTLGGPR